MSHHGAESDGKILCGKEYDSPKGFRCHLELGHSGRHESFSVRPPKRKKKSKKQFQAYKKGVKLSLTVSPVVSDVINKFLATGLYGRSRSEVAQRLLYDKIRTEEISWRK